jgi:hypothetical protein
MTTSSVLSGILIVDLHLGHGPLLPANLSFTWNRVRQEGHVTLIGMTESLLRLCQNLPYYGNKNTAQGLALSGVELF